MISHINIHLISSLHKLPPHWQKVIDRFYLESCNHHYLVPPIAFYERNIPVTPSFGGQRGNKDESSSHCWGLAFRLIKIASTVGVAH